MMKCQSDCLYVTKNDHLLERWKEIEMELRKFDRNFERKFERK